MSNKQKTAVDYLYFMMSNPLYSGGNNQKLFQQAKELEKKQIINALHHFDIDNAQDYYTETYGG